MKTIACVIARLRSQRLPRKVLADVEGVPVLTRLVRRMQSATSVDQVVLCTTSRPEDRGLLALADELGIGWVAGSETDVLSRMLAAAERYEADRLVRVTGDNILTCPVVLDQLSEAMDRTGSDYARMNDLPIGATPEILTVALASHLHATIDPDRSEYLLLYAFDPSRHACVALQPPEALRRPFYTLTLDTPADLARICAIHADVPFDDDRRGPSLADVCRYLDSRDDYGRIPPDAPIRLPGGETMSYRAFLDMLEARRIESSERGP